MRVCARSFFGLSKVDDCSTYSLSGYCNCNCYLTIGPRADSHWRRSQAREEDLHHWWQRCNFYHPIFVWFATALLLYTKDHPVTRSYCQSGWCHFYVPRALCSPDLCCTKGEREKWVYVFWYNIICFVKILCGRVRVSFHDPSSIGGSCVSTDYLTWKHRALGT